MWRPDLAKQDSDDRFAEKIAANVEAMADRRVLVRYVLVLGTVNLLMWVCVLLLTASVRDGFSQVWSASDKIGKIVLAMVFGIGMWLTYALFRMKFPDIEEQRLDSEIMGSFAYQSDSTKRWMVWVLSAVGGLLNVGLLVAVAMAL
jgi:hypothetical protein